MKRNIIGEGIVVGLAGATAVAVWFLLYDLAAGTPLRTPALLGAAIFEGLRDPAALEITSALVLKYTVAHGLAFLAFGFAVAGLFALVDYERRVLFAVFMLFCCFEVFAVGMILTLAEQLTERDSDLGHPRGEPARRRRHARGPIPASPPSAARSLERRRVNGGRRPVALTE